MPPISKRIAPEVSRHELEIKLVFIDQNGFETETLRPKASNYMGGAGGHATEQSEDAPMRLRGLHRLPTPTPIGSLESMEKNRIKHETSRLHRAPVPQWLEALGGRT